MSRKVVLATFFIAVLIGTLGLSFVVQRVEASGTIYIRADGSIDPPTAPVSTLDNVTYAFTGNITSDADGIVVERDNIVVDGKGYTLEGTGAEYPNGIYMNGRSNVTIKNMNIRAFYFGIFSDSSGNSASGNNMTNNSYGIDFSSDNNNITRNNFVNNGKVGIYIAGSFNTLSGNDITNSSCGIELEYSSNNMVNGNSITTNHYWGVWLIDSSNNSISGNNIANSQYGIYLSYSSNNSVYHNNFIGNAYQVGGTVETYSSNVWDDGYPSGGNYWSDYTGIDADHDGIGDIPYIIDANNTDNYPLMVPTVISEFPIFFILPFFMIVTLLAVMVCTRKEDK